MVKGQSLKFFCCTYWPCGASAGLWCNTASLVLPRILLIFAISFFLDPPFLVKFFTNLMNGWRLCANARLPLYLYDRPIDMKGSAGVTHPCIIALITVIGGAITQMLEVAWVTTFYQRHPMQHPLPTPWLAINLTACALYNRCETVELNENVYVLNRTIQLLGSQLSDFPYRQR